MRTALALLIAGLSCAAAQAETPPSAFVHAAVTPSYVYMVDLGTIQAEGELKVATVLMVGRTDEALEGVTGKVNYKTFSTAFSCQKRTMQVRSVKYYSERGDYIRGDTLSQDLLAIVPETSDADVLDIVCRGEAPERPSMRRIEDAVRFGRGVFQTIDRMSADKR